ncbi:MAG: glycosyltransferase [Scytolyngbya sp. HA4215-MV1]|jgi:cellulose synthase (UDP-forming)|nr:glycosyltransferase [Scytolyngbya sp. HA4215-MV1]
MTNPATILENSPSFIGNLRSRLKKRTLLFRYLAEINLILGAWYLQWRIGHSINFNALWLAIPLLAAEIYSYLGGVMFTIGLWRPLERQVRSFDQLSPPIHRENWALVDVFITCYNEPVDLVEQTTRAALAMDYPVTKLRVYVLDDGNSPEMRAMTQQLGLEDLKSPLLQAEVKRIKAERSQLVEQLDQLKQMMPEAEAAEQFVQSIPEASQPSEKFLKTFHHLLQHGSNHTSITAQLSAEQRKLETTIHQKELELTDLVRCRYIARPKPAGKPHHAKAGNINYAIFSGETTGEFILTLDADHIPRRQFLKRILPYFYTYNLAKGRYESNQIAFVQTPQNFYNLPPHDPFGHRANLFYGPIQQGKDGLNSAFYTGTNAVLRREALVSVGLKYFSAAFAKDETRLDEFDLIGGMSSSSITEDMNTAMRLHGAGWKSIYHNELLAEGLAPDDLSSTLKQRLRWAQGTIQVLLQENPWKKPGLTFWQRLQYFQTMYSYFSGFATFILIVCPILYFFTGVIPVNAYGSDFALHFFPAFVINRLTFTAATWGIQASEVWRSEQYAIALFPLFIQAVWSVFTKRPIKFQVTPKQRQSGIYLRLVLPQLIIFGLTLLGIAWSLLRFAMGSLPDPWVHLLNSAWAIYNLSLLWAVIRAAVWQPKEVA